MPSLTDLLVENGLDGESVSEEETKRIVAQSVSQLLDHEIFIVSRDIKIAFDILFNRRKIPEITRNRKDRICTPHFNSYFVEEYGVSCTPLNVLLHSMVEKIHPGDKVQVHYTINDPRFVNHGINLLCYYKDVKKFKKYLSERLVDNGVTHHYTVTVF